MRSYMDLIVLTLAVAAASTSAVSSAPVHSRDGSDPFSSPVPGNDYAPPPSYEDHLAATQALSFRPPAYNHLGFPLPAGANPPPPPISNPLASANHPAGANPSAGSPPNPAKRPRPDSPDGNPHAAKRPHIV